MRWQDEFRQFFPITRPRLRQHRLHQSAVAQGGLGGGRFLRRHRPCAQRQAGLAGRCRRAARAPGLADRRRRAPAGLYQEHDGGAEHRGPGPALARRRQPGGGRPGASFERAAVAEPATARRGRARGLVGRASLHRGRHLGARGCAHAAGRAVLVQYATGLRSDIAELAGAARRATSGWWWTAYRAPACCARGSTTGAWTRSPVARTRACSARWAWASCICRRRCWTRWIRRTWGRPAACRWTSPDPSGASPRPTARTRGGWRPAI